MKLLLSLTAVFEAVTGITLMVLPALPVRILMGTPLDVPAGQVIGRVAGAALFALGIACWHAGRKGSERSVTGLVTAMLFYNVAAVVILGYARFGENLDGFGLWPAILLHAALAGWCTAYLPIRHRD